MILFGFVLVNALSHDEYLAAFKDYVKKFNKHYDSKEIVIRFLNFKRHLDKINRHKETGPHSYSLGLTKFSDWSWEEFKDKILITEPQDCSATQGSYLLSGKANPSSIDWRSKGVVTDVKDQGDCGSCWTFSTTGCLESQHAIVTGNLVGLSEQNLIDCANAFNNNGCDGGLPSQAFEYIYFNGGIDTESSYPYEGEDDNCRYDPSNIGAKISGIVNITQGDENSIVDAVANVGPISIAFEVLDDFMDYDSGVYSNSDCSTDPSSVNHAVLIVGYNVTTDSSKTDFWIVKNSWGEDWGLNGYFWIQRGVNMCGLADCASYPQVAH